MEIVETVETVDDLYDFMRYFSSDCFRNCFHCFHKQMLNCFRFLETVSTTVFARTEEMLAMKLEEITIPSPKHLSDLSADANLTIGSGTLEDRPECAALVALLLAKMAEVDQLYEMMAISLFASEARAIVHMIRAIRSSDQRERAIERIIQENAQSDLVVTYRAVKPKIQKVREIRNSFAHGLWGNTSAHPEVLLLTSSANLNMSYAVAKQAERIASSGGNPIDPLEDIKRFPRREEIEVWSKSELREALRAAAGATNAAQSLLVCVDRGPGEVPHLHSAIRKYGLLSLPANLISKADD